MCRVGGLPTCAVLPLVMIASAIWCLGERGVLGSRMKSGQGRAREAQGQASGPGSSPEGLGGRQAADTANQALPRLRSAGPLAPPPPPPPDSLPCSSTRSVAEGWVEICSGGTAGAPAGDSARRSSAAGGRPIGGGGGGLVASPAPRFLGEPNAEAMTWSAWRGEDPLGDSASGPDSIGSRLRRVPLARRAEAAGAQLAVCSAAWRWPGAGAEGDAEATVARPRRCVSSAQLTGRSTCRAQREQHKRGRRGWAACKAQVPQLE